jgi:uncharacterized protein (DUF362 family)
LNGAICILLKMSKVVVVRLTDGPTKQQAKKDQYRRLLNSGLTLLTGQSSPSAAVAKLIPKGIVGMKTNCLSPRITYTSPNLSHALAELLIEGGRKENDIIIWERTNRELKRAGYELNASSFGLRCLGTDTNLVGYSRKLHSYKEVNSRVTRILTDMVAANVNLPVLKDHSMAGLSGGLKNMYGAIHNPNKYHDNNCNPYAAQVSMLEPLKSRNVLSILDAVNVQYQGGPGPNEGHLASYGGLVISNDPVSADRVGLEIIEYYRAVNGFPTLAKSGRPPDYLKTAETLGLGIEDMNRIEVVVRVVTPDGSVQPGELLS